MFNSSKHDIWSNLEKKIALNVPNFDCSLFVYLKKICFLLFYKFCLIFMRQEPHFFIFFYENSMDKNMFLTNSRKYKPEVWTPCWDPSSFPSADTLFINQPPGFPLRSIPSRKRTKGQYTVRKRHIRTQIQRKNQAQCNTNNPSKPARISTKTKVWSIRK